MRAAKNVGPRLFVFGGFDPLSTGAAAAHARAMLRRACAGQPPRLGMLTADAVEPAVLAAWAARAQGSGLRLEGAGFDSVLAAAVAGELDLVHVPAGHTAHLLHRLAPWAARLRARWEAGLVLSGQSGGGLCFASRLWSASRFGTPEWIEGLGFAPLALCVHFDQPMWAKPELPVPGFDGDVVALDHDAVLDWASARSAFVAARPGARGWQLGAGRAPAALPTRDLRRGLAWWARGRRALGRLLRRGL
jgi:hypothetical protein